MGINDGNKTDQFDNSQTQLVHNDTAYQAGTETTLSSVNTKITDGTQKTRITNGSVDAAINNSTPSVSTQGLVVRSLPYRPPTFSVTGVAITLGSQKSMLAIQNTSNSIVRISKIYLVNTRTAAITGVAANFTLQRIASFTGGVPLFSYPHNTLNTLPSGITFATGAIFTSESALFRSSDWSTDEWGPGTLDQEGLDHAIQSNIPWYKTEENEEPITLIQNQGLHIKCNTVTRAGEFTITIVFTVETA